MTASPMACLRFPQALRRLYWSRVSTRRELAKWWKDGVTDQELATRKQGVIGSYFVGLSTTLGLAETILVNTQRGFDPGWLDAYPKALKALTREQVNAAIKTHLNPSTMVLVEAGSVPSGARVQ